MTHLYKLPRDHLSASALIVLLRCPKQFEFRYIDGHIVQPGTAQIKGSATHRMPCDPGACRIGADIGRIAGVWRDNLLFTK